MFGKNEVSPINRHEDGSLMVHSIFPTLQGEGPDAGRPACFIRLTGCNLRCYFCDTEFSSGERMSVAQVIEKVRDVDPWGRLAVLTGGEPFLQNIGPLVAHLVAIGREVAVETAGTVKPSQEETFWFHPRHHSLARVICSPKTPKIDPTIAALAHSFKYIVREGELSAYDGLPEYSTQMKGGSAILYRPPDIRRVSIYLQPCDEQDAVKTARNLAEAVASCLKNGWYLSIQQHKLAGLP